MNAPATQERRSLWGARGITLYASHLTTAFVLYEYSQLLEIACFPIA
jgi:hypothetical protein